MNKTKWGKACPRCGVAQTHLPCVGCRADYDQRRPADQMTGDERAAELSSWDHAVIDFGLIHQRIEELVGRPVWTHEMGSVGWPRLEAEARSWKHPENLLEHVLTTAEEAAPGEDIPVVVD